MHNILCTESNRTRLWYFKISLLVENCDDIPDLAEKLVAAAVIVLVVFINCASVRHSSKFLTICGCGKAVSLVIIIVEGIAVLLQGKKFDLVVRLINV